MSRKTLVTLLLIIVSALLAVALFIAGAIWRGRVTTGITGSYLPGELGVGDEFSISLNNDAHKFEWLHGLRK
jgi:hypothetical protein